MDELITIGSSRTKHSDQGECGSYDTHVTAYGVHPHSTTVAITSGIKRKKVFIKTYGCQMNEYDSSKLLKLLDSSHEPVANAQDADLIILNTCSVREKPERKLYGLLDRLRSLKHERPGLMIGVGGCVAQQEGQRLVERSPVVDFVFGTHNLSLVPALITQRETGAPPQVAVNYREDWEDLPFEQLDNSRVSVFVSISRGCNKNCTYCIVPTTRGKEVSRDPSEIEREVRLAVQGGAREVVLLGQTVNSYGYDLPGRVRFTDLLNRLSSIDGVLRLRFTSPHPQEVRKDFIDLIAENPTIGRHIHMPLQSGSDRILKLMNRNYRREKYLRIVNDLKARVPDIALTTDIIVGFPGETERDFEETLEVMRYVHFDSSYSFTFSPRPGTVAAEMSELLSRKEKLGRLQTLQALQDEITEARLRAWVGRDAEVLLEGPSRTHPDRLQGRTSQNILVNLDQRYQGLEPGMLVVCRISEASRFTLRGELPDRSSEGPRVKGEGDLRNSGLESPWMSSLPG